MVVLVLFSGHHAAVLHVHTAGMYYGGEPVAEWTNTPKMPAEARYEAMSGGGSSKAAAAVCNAPGWAVTASPAAFHMSGRRGEASRAATLAACCAAWLSRY